ncbi:MAG: monovalent cation/H(+) antiporter subunit G [Acidimicrobiales bacterium]
MAHAAALALVGLGTAVTALAALGALAVDGDDLTRCHFLSPATSLGGPLVCLGLCVEQGWGLATGEVLVIGALMVVTGPALSAAVGRLVAQQSGAIRTEPPE